MPFDETRAPPLRLLIREPFNVLSRFWRGFGHLHDRGPEDGEPVLVIPGFLASDRTTLGLQRALARAGYRVGGWRMGLNKGATLSTIDDIIGRLGEFADGRPAILIGWSLGGIYAREVAKRRPDLVRKVVTMGTPFSGNPRANNAWRMYERVAGHPVDDPPIKVRSGAKPPVETIALWSRRDGMVAAASARGLPHQSDRQIEIDASHMGFAVSARAFRQILDVLKS